MAKIKSGNIAQFERGRGQRYTAYAEGNTVRKAAVFPAQERGVHEVSQQVIRNRERARHMDMRYVVFLSVCAVVTVMICIYFLKQQTICTYNQKQVTELTTQLIQKSEAMWAYASYEPEQEIEEAGIHYTLTSLSKDEWMQTDRLKNVTKYLSCQEGQEVSETLDVETADEVTGEALYGTIGRIELKEDGADWKEGALEEWDIYSWNGESWVYQRNDECFYATEESPWFEGYEAVFMQEHHLDGVFNQITSIEWYGDGWQDEEGNWKRSVRITGNKMVPRYQAIYSGDVAQPDLPMVCYKAQYTSDPQGYLITADVTYEKIQEEAVQEEENADESILKSISEEFIKTLQQNKTNEKFWYLLLAALMAVSVGLQVAVIFVLAFRER